MSAPFFVTRSLRERVVPIGTVDADHLGDAEDLANAMFGRLRVDGSLDTSGLIVWHRCQAEAWYKRARQLEQAADAPDVLASIKLHWRRFFDRTEKHNH